MHGSRTRQQIYNYESAAAAAVSLCGRCGSSVTVQQSALCCAISVSALFCNGGKMSSHHHYLKHGFQSFGFNIWFSCRPARSSCVNLDGLATALVLTNCGRRNQNQPSAELGAGWCCNWSNSCCIQNFRAAANFMFPLQWTARPMYSDRCPCNQPWTDNE